MFNSQVDEIKSRLDIVNVVGERIKLQKSGANYRAFCPFHSEKNPSFFVSPARQIWHCFSCGKGGDVFKFVMEIEGVEFRDALEKLAQKAGVVLKREDPSLTSERKKLHDILEAAAKFFQNNLENNKEVLNYLKSRGLNDETISDFRLGYALDSSLELLTFLKQRGFYERDIEKAGLIIHGDRGYFDRFRGRIMFPIFDLSGNAIGFSGRIIKEKESSDVAKYMNSPNTLLYDKSSALYGIHKAALEIRKNDFCILVEGQMDLVMSHQAGVKNVVAASGTALSERQLNIISRYSKNLYMSFDMDSAGQSATKRTIDLARNLDFNIKIILIPHGKDPADLIKENPVLWRKSIAEARPVMEFYFENTFSKYDPNILEQKKQIAHELLSQIKKNQNKIEAEYWLKVLSEKINVSENSLREELEKINLNEQDYNYSLHRAADEVIENIELSKTQSQFLAERLLVLLFKNPQHISHIHDFKQDHFKDLLSDFKLITKDRKEILFLKLIEEIINHSSLDLSKLESNHAEFLDNLLFEEECFPAKIEIEDIEKEILFCKREIQAKFVREKLNQLNSVLKNEIDEAKQSQILLDIQTLSKELNKIMKIR